MGLSEKSEYVLFYQDYSQWTDAHQCPTIPGNSRSADLHCRRGHCGHQLTTCSHGTLPGKLAHMTGADLVYLITMWYRRVGVISCYLCIKPCTHPTISSAPPRPTRQGAEAPEPILSATSMSNADGASEDRTTRTGRGHTLAINAGLLYSSAKTMAGSMRSRSRKMLKLDHTFPVVATGPPGGENDGRFPSRVDVEEYVLLYHYDTKRSRNRNLRQLLSVRVRFGSSHGAMMATHTWRHSDRMVCIIDADHTCENGGIVKTAASGAVMISAGKNARADELHIKEGSMGTDAFVSRMYKRTSCRMHVGETVRLQINLFGAFPTRVNCSFEECDDLTRSTMMSRWRDVIMLQCGYCFILVTPLDEYLTHRVGEDAVQHVPPTHTVTELEANAPVFLRELIGLQVEQAEGVIKEGIANDDMEFHVIGRQSGHLRERTSSGNLQWRIRGRAIKPVFVQPTSETAEKSMYDERVLHMTCYIMLVGMPTGSGTIVWLCDFGSLTQRGYEFIPYEKRGETSRHNSGNKNKDECYMLFDGVITDDTLPLPST